MASFTDVHVQCVTSRWSLYMYKHWYLKEQVCQSGMKCIYNRNISFKRSPASWETAKDLVHVSGACLLWGTRFWRCRGGQIPLGAFNILLCVESKLQTYIKPWCNRTDSDRHTGLKTDWQLKNKQKKDKKNIWHRQRSGGRVAANKVSPAAIVWDNLGQICDKIVNL